MNKKFCDACEKELHVYNNISPDKFKILKISPGNSMKRDVTDGDYEICTACYSKILLVLNPKILQNTSVTNSQTQTQEDIPHESDCNCKECVDT